MTQALAIYQPMTPAEYDADVSAAHLKAQTLMRVAEAQKLYTQIGQGKHLRVEGWLTIGRAYGYTVGTGETELLRDGDGAFYGVKAVAYVYDGNGLRVGQAENYCTNDEENWGNKPISQMAGMAQTRAVSRALRQLLSWVVVLAGYSATPAEEMIASKANRPNPADGVAELMCPIHNVEWFKRGRMPRFAHPIGTDKPAKAWCNMEDVQKDKVVDGAASPIEPTEADLGFGKGGGLIDPETLPLDAPQRPQEATDGASESVGASDGSAAPARTRRLENEPDKSYFFRVAWNEHKLHATEALAKLGSRKSGAPMGNWEAWIAEGHTLGGAVAKLEEK